MPIQTVHNEAVLVAQLIKGDEKAFAGLFDAYHHQLTAYVHSIIQSKEMAIEIVQDVYVKVWVNRHELKEVHHFTPWLFILTRNYTLNCLKKMARDRKKAQQYEQFVFTSSDPVTAAELRPDYLSLIDRAVAQLPPQQQQVYLLSRVDGLKYAEIAEKMGISPTTVKKYMQIALKAIAGFVKSHAVVLLMLLNR
ncbi:RNA polymerase sigma-70 factor [Chitinophaga sp. MM2321]|uniref:RNA polymerase sigma factor n=1 Tax=Chitinophaga sp. MM2321 TaxID=3137178 RepID=UPI0032D57C37